jgi:hypothetical protein
MRAKLWPHREYAEELRRDARLLVGDIKEQVLKTADHVLIDRVDVLDREVEVLLPIVGEHDRRTQGPPRGLASLHDALMLTFNLGCHVFDLVQEARKARTAPARKEKAKKLSALDKEMKQRAMQIWEQHPHLKGKMYSTGKMIAGMGPFEQRDRKGEKIEREPDTIGKRLSVIFAESDHKVVKKTG